jgi:peptidoglycan/LPS O-acetylase OafA/YrhL
MTGHAGGRLQHIDGLRGLAALLVLYQHLVEYLGRAAPAGSWAQLHSDWTLANLDLGKLGVVLFFAISGYIVPFSFGGTRPRLGFVLSRFFRLYPAYWLSIAAAALVLPLLGAPAFPARQLAANATMLQRLFGQPDVLGVYWTLLIEVSFYALCFALFCAGRLRSPRVLALVFGLALSLAVAGALLRSEGGPAAPVGLPLYLAIMLFGACLRLATLERDPRARRYAAPMLAILLMVIPLAWATAYDAHDHKEAVLADITAMCLGLLLFVYAVLRRALGWRPLMQAGAISYSVYLFHPLALEVALQLAARLAWPAGGWVQTAATLVLTLGVSWLVYRHVERPSILLGRHVLSALVGRSAAPRKLPAN